MTGGGGPCDAVDDGRSDDDGIAWKILAEYPLATSLQVASVGPAFLERPTRSEEGRPSGHRLRGAYLACGLRQ